MLPGASPSSSPVSSSRWGSNISVASPPDPSRPRWTAMSSSSADDPSPRTQLTLRAVALTVGVAVLLHLPALVRRKALNSDEATIAVIARMMRHGATLYSDAVDRKPPGAFVLYRLLEPVFGQATLPAARWVALVAMLVAAWVLALEAVRRWPEVSALAVALAVVFAFSVLPAEDSRAVSFEGLATLPAVAAFVLGARRRTVLAAIALGIAALFKQTLLLGALPLTVQCLTIPGFTWGRRIGRLAIAGGVTVLSVLAGLVWFGLGDALHWFAGAGDNYLGGTTVSMVLKVAGSQIGEFLAMTAWLIILIGVAWWGRVRRMPLDAVAWTVAGVIAATIGFRWLFHYFNQLLPAMVLLAAPALVLTTLFRGWWRRFALLCLAGAVVFSMITTVIPEHFHHLPNVDDVAAAVRDNTEPGDRIFVWGQAPEIYWLSGRDPATRYPHVGFITGITPKRPGVPASVLSMPGAAENLLADLQANPPALVVDAAIKSVRGGDRYPLQDSPIAEFVEANYCEIGSIDGVRLLASCST